MGSSELNKQYTYLFMLALPPNFKGLKMDIPDRPRITVDISAEQWLFCQQLPPGAKKLLFCSLINMMRDMVERLGPKSLGLIVGESFGLEDYFKE